MNSRYSFFSKNGKSLNGLGSSARHILSKSLVEGTLLPFSISEIYLASYPTISAKALMESPFCNLLILTSSRNSLSIISFIISRHHRFIHLPFLAKRNIFLKTAEYYRIKVMSFYRTRKCFLDDILRISLYTILFYNHLRDKIECGVVLKRRVFIHE